MLHLNLTWKKIRKEWNTVPIARTLESNLYIYWKLAYPLLKDEFPLGWSVSKGTRYHGENYHNSNLKSKSLWDCGICGKHFLPYTDTVCQMAVHIEESGKKTLLNLLHLPWHIRFSPKIPLEEGENQAPRAV